ncbi:flagellar motor protein MotB [Sandarakinorhabdus rubra]|uniref:flagellar motor protein MotB n=1 Tax=Sandarakinorhabdus rubra TaxID=2672568 RepID=UPI0013DB6C41|nr:flagellar motor protein MotB [Sandarakinorhabdus rubra]
MKPEPHIEPEIVYRKVKAHGHAHHGGAWKIAYADFVTAMMAFFMLLWILGATTEDQRKGIADYFTPTVIQLQNSGGSNGLFGGRSVVAPDGTAVRPETTGTRPVTSAGSDAPSSRPGDARGASAGSGNPKAPQTGDSRADAERRKDEARLDKVVDELKARLEADPTLKGLKGQVRFVKTRDGLRIDLVERADFAMFALGTSAPTKEAGELVGLVARAIAETPNRLTVRGHTDALGYSGRNGASNWSLSSARADATRRLLMGGGIDASRFRRIEGVADTDPYVKEAPLDPRNRRISVTLLYEDPA